MAVLADADKRSSALDPHGSFHLTAPAGSGKTFLLVARFLRLLGIVDHPRQILALTFTNKAAAEMRERVRGCLERAKTGAPPESPAEAELLDYASKALAAHGKLEELLLAGEILHIRTFHSFCYAVASQAPFEAGIAPGSTLMDEDEQKFFLHETVTEGLQQIASRGEGDPARRAFMNRLLYLNNSWWSLASEMKELVKRREGLVDLVQVLSRDLASGFLAAKVRELAETELNALRAEFETCELGRGWAGFLKQTGSAGAEAACILPADIPGAQWEALPQWICLADVFLTREGEIRKQLGPKAGFYNGFAKTAWGGVIQNIPQETARRLHQIRQLPAHDAPVADPDTLWDLVVLLHSVLEIYDARRRAKRALDYSSLELAALRLFDAADPSDLQLILDQQIRHILVDEFQDTSREQWELLQKLCTGWSDGDGRTLFLVGDPKQSIYGFRKAEVKLFLDARLGLPLEDGGKIGLESIVLDTNFRSQPHLIDWCNRVFEKTVMAEHKPEFDEVPFSPAKPSPTTRVLEGPAPVELALFLEWPDRESARVREATWLAGRVARHLAENGRDSQRAILLFSRTHLPVYLEAFRQEKVPVQVKEGLKLLERPEVFYLWQLCRGIVLPHDNLAWASQLRSPWFSLDFDRIHAISREQHPLWIEKIHAFSERDQKVDSFRQALAEAWQHVGHEPLADVVESAWLELEGARVAVSTWGSRGLNCCRRFIDMLREAEQGEPVRTLARLEQLLMDAYEPVDPDTALSNVVLSTVHGAKGLEFDAVFIPFLDWNPEGGRKDQPPPYMLERAPCSGDYLLASRPDRLTGEKDPLYAWLRRLRSRRQLGEARRLFYVAVTRARRELVMSGLAKKKGNSFSTSAENPLGWLGKHYGIDELCGIDGISCPEQAECRSEWKRSVRGVDGFLIHLEPTGGTADLAGRGGAGGLQEASARGSESSRPELAPAEFEREKPAFTVVSPSGLRVFGEVPSIANGRTDRGDPGSGTSFACPPNVWGTLIHMLFACFGKTGTLPSARSASAALSRIGIESSKSLDIAREALLEVQSCLDDPWLQAFYRIPPDRRRVEWSVECAHQREVIYSGVIDLAAQIEGKWNVVDFKTSRPAVGEQIEDFLQREAEAYRLQILAYCEILSKHVDTDPAGIDAFIYWTALRLQSRIMNE